MSKVRNFSEIAPNIAFPEFNFYELYYSTYIPASIHNEVTLAGTGTSMSR